MLETLSQLGPTKHGSIIVRVPEYIATPQLHHTILVEDIPNAINATEYLAKYGEDISPKFTRDLGVSLGKWLRMHHQWLNGSSPSAMLLKSKLKDSGNIVDTRQKLYVGSYRETMEVFPDVSWPTSQQFDEIEADVRKVCKAGQAVHGDYGLGK